MPVVHSDLLYHVLDSQLAKMSSVLSSPSFYQPCASREDGRADSLNWTAWPTVLKCNLIFFSLSLFASASSHGAAFCCATQAEKCPQLSAFTKLLKGEISPFLPEKNRFFFLFPFPCHPLIKANNIISLENQILCKSRRTFQFLYLKWKSVVPSLTFPPRSTQTIQ